MIIATARAMLDELPLDAVTLNGLARRAGLASSNVLRYFDSREAVLLALVVAETDAWLADIVDRPVDPAGPLPERCAAAADVLAQALDGHPRFCELISVQAAVLERNVSADTAVAFKSASSAQLHRLAGWLAAALPELPAADPATLRLAANATLLAGALWAQSRSQEVLAAQLVEHPELTTPTTFSESAREAIRLLLRGGTGEARPG